MAHAAQSASAIDAAEHRAALDVDVDAAAHVAGRQGLAAEAAAAAEDVALDVARAVVAYVGIVLDGHLDVAHDVAVLAAAEDGAVDAGRAGDFHLDIVHISGLVEEDALVALACTEEVAGDGVGGYLRQRAWHAEGAAAHLHRALAARLGDVVEHVWRLVGQVGHLPHAALSYVGHLVAAIDRGEYVAAGDLHRRVALHPSGRGQPLSGGVRLVARAAAEDVAVEGVAVGARGVGVVGRRDSAWIHSVFIGKLVVGRVGSLVGPADALQVGGVGGCVVGCPYVVVVGFCRRLSAAYLSALYLHVGVGKHVAALGAAIDAAPDEGRAADGHQGLVHIARGLQVGVFSGVVHLAAPGTEYIAVAVGHGQLVGTHGAAADGDGAEARSLGAAVGLAHGHVAVLVIVFSVGIGEGAHRAHGAAAIDGACHAAAVHRHRGVALDETCQWVV